MLVFYLKRNKIIFFTEMSYPSMLWIYLNWMCTAKIILSMLPHSQWKMEISLALVLDSYRIEYWVQLIYKAIF